MKGKKQIAWEDSADEVQSERDAVVKEVVASTPGGKDVQIKRNNLGLWFAEFSSGGELPAKLKQHWTSRFAAAAAVQDYVTNG